MLFDTISQGADILPDEIGQVTHEELHIDANQFQPAKKIVNIQRRTRRVLPVFFILNLTRRVLPETLLVWYKKKCFSNLKTQSMLGLRYYSEMCTNMYTSRVRHYIDVIKDFYKLVSFPWRTPPNSGHFGERDISINLLWGNLRITDPPNSGHFLPTETELEKTRISKEKGKKNV